MSVKKEIKRIKENITEKEYKKLMAFVRGDEKLRKNTKSNLLRTFTLLFFSGLRVNEVQELKIKDIKKLLDEESIKIDIKKTSSERKLYLTPSLKKELLKIFDFNIEEDDNRIITKGSCKNKNVGINNIVFIQQVNSVIKEILGVGYSSHSFRQGLITEMSSKQINIKIISKFIGHKNVSTTMGYINPSDEQIIGSLIR
ncbi:tyrosine-type recombinase/integrase [Poseidonibacter ostreae]|uniref:tyrosine-type recombinase/integrase n=1 Tax=Poseidonibacter ostreae TaxID=2654171 RepID=UPI0012654070|nr:site-specific integrase [Poseidonibacter ostreae]KAB7886407.1 tyrosine-type recombinase/integrase [Poseidonibacter ostreae]